MSADVVVILAPARVSTRSVGEEMFPPWFEPTPAVKKPPTVVRPVSHIPSFGGQCYPGVSRFVPADDDSSSFSFGSYYPCYSST